MKKSFYLFTLLTICLLINSCDKSEIEYDNELEKSYKVWLEFKNHTENSYIYTTTSSSWTGYSSETAITVVDGKIIQRSFKMTKLGDIENEIPQEELEWTENETEINTHARTPASEAILLDDIYEKARKEWLLKRNNAQSFFETNNMGLISTCGYVPDGCMDDCFIGIKIKSIKAL